MSGEIPDPELLNPTASQSGETPDPQFKGVIAHGIQLTS